MNQNNGSATTYQTQYRETCTKQVVRPVKPFYLPSGINRSLQLASKMEQMTFSDAKIGDITHHVSSGADYFFPSCALELHSYYRLWRET